MVPCMHSPRWSRSASAAFTTGDESRGLLVAPALARVQEPMDLFSALCNDLTQHAERLVSRRESCIAADLEQRLTQLVRGPPEVQRAAQVRLELVVVCDGGEDRNRQQAGIFELQTGPIPHSTPDVLDGGLEERRQKRIAWCLPLKVRFTYHALTDRCAARPCVLCHGYSPQCLFNQASNSLHRTVRSKTIRLQRRLTALRSRRCHARPSAPTTGNIDHRSADPARVVGGEERRDRSDLLWTANTAERRTLHRLLLEVAAGQPRGRITLGGDRAKTQRVHANRPRPEFLRQRARDRIERRLGAAVHRCHRRRELARHPTDIDDAAAFWGKQRDRGLGREE